VRPRGTQQIASGDVLRNVGIAIVCELLRVPAQNIFKHKHRNTASQSSGHQRKTNEQEQSSPPHSSRVTKSFISSDTVFVDHVNDQHAKEGTDAWDPVDEIYMDWRWDLRLVIWGMCMRRKDRGIKKGPIC